jgi:hypothetical protein
MGNYRRSLVLLLCIGVIPGHALAVGAPYYYTNGQNYASVFGWIAQQGCSETSLRSTWNDGMSACFDCDDDVACVNPSGYCASNFGYYNEATQSCSEEDPNQPTCNDPVGTRYGTGNIGGLGNCIGGCETTLQRHITSGGSSIYTYVTNGNDCEPDAPIPEPDDYWDLGGTEPNCMEDEKGNVYCDTPPDDPNSNCGTFNGMEVCPDDEQPGCGTINGQYGCYEDEQNCGEFNGQYGCFEPPPGDPDIIGPQNSAPEGCMSNGSGGLVCVGNSPKDYTTSSSENNPDGTTTTTTTSGTNVSGGGTTTTTTTVAPNGDTTEYTTYNAGPRDADGDGNLDDAEDPDEGSVSGGGSCESEPVCEGDPQECAILRQAWETRCAVEDLTEGDDPPEGLFDYSGVMGEALLENGLFESVDLANEWDIPSITGSPGSCPAPVQVSIPYLGRTASIPYDMICTFLDVIRPVFLAVMLFFAGRFVLKEI